MSVYDAAMRYMEEGVPLIIIAGKQYGVGSSRDWAAQGPALLGVKAVIAESFERIHRSNLVGMGILPLTFLNPEDRKKLKGNEVFDIEVGGLKPGKIVKVKVRRNGESFEFLAKAEVKTPAEVEYLKAGGILRYAAENILRGKA